MKKIFKSALVVCAALAIVGCQNSALEAPEAGTKSVTIKISQPSATRAVGAAVTAADAVTVSDGWLYFAAGGAILDTYEIVSGEATGAQVPFSELEAGRTFTGLPATIDAVYFAGNAPTGAGAVTTVAALQALEADLAALATVSDIPVYGSDTSLEDGADEDSIIEANIEARPIAARLEIAALPTTSDAAISSAIVRGIYLDNIYLGVTLGGSVIGTAQGGEIEGATSNASYNYPNAGWQIEDLSSDYAASGLSLDTDEVFGYNLPASSATTLPNIILELGVQFVGEASARTLYLTYVNSGSFAPGTVYKASLPAFDSGDLTNYPYQDAISIEVDVTIMPWSVANVTYTFN